MNSLKRNEKLVRMNHLKNGFFLPYHLEAYPLKRKDLQWQKRVLDIVVSLLLLALVLTWLIPILALCLLIDSGSPVFFLQKRVGHFNKVFCCYKLRTMTESQAGQPKNISKFGWILRYLKLDETPQLLNVLKGEMSLVGPRPHTLNDHESFKNAIGPQYELRHYVKPGITGLAQIKGFEGPIDSLEKLNGRIQHDLKYINNWTLGLDLQIIWQTVIYILKLLFKKVSN